MYSGEDSRKDHQIPAASIKDIRKQPTHIQSQWDPGRLHRDLVSGRSIYSICSRAARFTKSFFSWPSYQRQNISTVLPHTHQHAAHLHLKYPLAPHRPAAVKLVHSSQYWSNSCNSTGRTGDTGYFISSSFYCNHPAHFSPYLFSFCTDQHIPPKTTKKQTL